MTSSHKTATVAAAPSETETDWEALSDDMSAWTEVSELEILSESDSNSGDEDNTLRAVSERTAGACAADTPAVLTKEEGDWIKKESRAAKRRRQRRTLKEQQLLKRQPQQPKTGRFDALLLESGDSNSGFSSSAGDLHRRLANEEVKQRSVAHSKISQHPDATHHRPDSFHKGKDAGWRGAGTSNGESKKLV